jgi:HSP20 family protein
MRAFLNISPTRAFVNSAAQQMAVDAMLAGVFGQAQCAETTAATAKNIAVDVSESEAAYTVYAALPGVKREDIDVKVEGKAVSISAKLKTPVLAAESETWLRREHAAVEDSAVTESARRFTLRHDVDETKVAARYQDGVLTLTLPKKTVSAAASITIQ